MRIVEYLKGERAADVSHGLYYNLQVLSAYNSNHMEGSTLTPDQTAQIYETGQVVPTGGGDALKVDDVIEARNHFRAFDYVLDHADDALDGDFIRTLHAILFRGTSKEDSPFLEVGRYKARGNVIGGIVQTPTVAPEDVEGALEGVFAAYAELADDPYEIARDHWMFERVHPFSDGNGRVGRLVATKELMRIDALPGVVPDRHRALYVQGLKEFAESPERLVDVMLASRDVVEGLVGNLGIASEVDYTFNERWARPEADARMGELLSFLPGQHAANDPSDVARRAKAAACRQTTVEGAEQGRNQAPRM